MNAGDSVFFSPDRDTTGIGNAEDIIQSDGNGGFGIFFDGSSLGISGANIDAFDIVSSTEILMSFSRALTLDGIGLVDDSDIVQFNATSLGENATAGSFAMVLDGSTIGLTQPTEDIDALTRLDDGTLLFSTSASASTINGLQTVDEDLIQYNPANGEVSLYFDGSDVGLTRSREDVNAVTVVNNQLLLSTTGRFAVNGISGQDEDVFSFTATTTGTNTQGVFDSVLCFDGSALGFTGDIAALDIAGPATLNNAPDALNDAFITAEETAFGGNLFADNGGGADVDPDGDAFTVTSNTNPTNGNVVVNADGTFTYTPNANFNGIDSFDYTITDINGGTDTATVNITVVGVNDAPDAVDDVFTTAEDTAVNGNLFADNGSGVDTDIDGDAFTVTNNTAPVNGMVVVNADGTFTYTPNANFNGGDSFTYTIDDGNGGTDTATVNITVNAVNDAPDAVDDVFTTAEDTAFNGNLFADNGSGVDSDIDGNAFTITSNTTATNGAVVVNADGTFTYTPNANFNGGDSFTYTIDDGNGGTDTATVNITVTGVNDAPDAVNDVFTTAEDTAVNGNLFADNGSGVDADIDGDVFTVTSNTTATNGAVVVNADGTFTYTPNANFNGGDSFTYTIDDGNGGTDTATVNITVNAVNDAPDAVDDAFTTAEDTAVNGNLFADNGSGVDLDIDGNAFTVTSNTTATNGTVIVNTDGTFTYTPTANFNGGDSFTYTIDDGNGGTDTATVNITVTAVNDAPDAVDDAFTTAEDTVINGNLFADNGNGVDLDIDGDVFTVTNNTLPAFGVLEMNANGTFTYSPNANFNGSDSFTYTIDDGNGGTDTATVNITVTAVNDAPINAVPGAQTTDDATPINFGSGIQISDVDADAGIVQSTLSVGFGTLTATTGGGATVTTNGTTAVTITGTIAQVNAALTGLVYDPVGTSGNATITLVTDDQGNTGTGGSLTDTDTIAVTVNPAVVAPDAVNDAFNVTGNVGISMASTIFGNDLGGTPTALFFGDTLGTASGTAANGTNTIATTNGGTVLLSADGVLTYTPAAGFTGTDSFFYFSSNAGGNDTAEVTFTVNDLIWFIDDTAGGTSDGTLVNPFTSLAAFNAVNNGAGNNPAAGDNIFLAAGNYTGGTTLLDGQALIGQGTTGTLDGLLGITLPTFSNPLPTLGGADPIIVNDGGNAITLGSGNTVRGLTISGATTQNGIVGNNVGNTLIDNVNFTGLALEAAQLTNTTANATITLQNNTVNSPNSSTGVELELMNNGSATNVTVNITNNTLSNVVNSAILVENNSNGTLNTTISGNNVMVNNAGSFAIEVEQVNNGTTTALIDNNTVSGQLNDSDVIFVNANNGTGTLNATITNNSNNTAPTGIGTGLFGRANNNNTLNLNISGNNFTGALEEIFLSQVPIPGETPTLNVTQASTANLSAVNNGGRVFTSGTINFNQPAPPVP
ncbi:beta strand repeat-containing protein [Leptothoe spongobia]|uniref:Tandem-95 repeat protein n=1 Tax=Leptothoe spongobia TAU-MAC 1115 TaxID=1967444 RepID=A0A947DB93_9CYAN|nr:cadherin-like domain-containing protein [Leptothoe spongobia]MBT9314085.1 tandem-95 repeat protein [Leptothoe spongobia TAU-MAC 1115]